MVIIGITGAIGHGKSTLAREFGQVEPLSRHMESFEIVAEVADRWHLHTAILPNPHKLEEVNLWLQMLPVILEEVVHERVEPRSLYFGMEDVTAQPELYEKLFTHIENLKQHPELLQNHINEFNKAAYRPILQWLGGYLVLKVDPGIWYKELMRRAEQANLEGMALCTIGGLRYPTDAEIVRASGGYILAIHRPMLGEQDAADLTERQRSKIRPDVTILNNASVVELQKVAWHVYDDIMLGKLKTNYAATEM